MRSSSTAPSTSSAPTSHSAPSRLLRTPGCPGTARRSGRTNPTATSGAVTDPCTTTTPTTNTSGPCATTEGAAEPRRKSPATASRNRDRRIPRASTAKNQRVQGRERPGSESGNERETVRGATSYPSQADRTTCEVLALRIRPGAKPVDGPAGGSSDRREALGGLLDGPEGVLLAQLLVSALWGGQWCPVQRSVACPAG